MSAFSHYLQDLRKIGSLALLPYRNFFHWTLSRVVVFLYALLATILLSLPIVTGMFFVLRSIWMEIDQSAFAMFLATGELSPDITGVLFSNWMGIVGVVLGGLVIFAIAAFFFTYAYYLLSNTYRGYILSERLPVLKNYFFSLRHIRKFLSVISWTSLYLLIPSLVALGLFLVFFAFSYAGIISVDSVSQSVIIGGVSLVMVITVIVFTLLIAFRYMFATVFLLADDARSSGKSYILESRSFVQWRIWKVILRITPFVLVLSLIAGISSHIENSLQYTRVSGTLMELQSKAGRAFENDHVFLSKHIVSAFTAALPEVEDIFNRYETRTDSIDPDFLADLMPYLDIDTLDPSGRYISFGFWFVNFLLFEGVVYMVYLSAFQVLGGALRREESSDSIVIAEEEEVEEEIEEMSEAIVPAKKKVSKKKE